MTDLTSRSRAIWAAVVSGVSAFIAFLANTPPEQQDALVGPIISVMPISWRPSIGIFMRALSSAAAIYMVMHATRSGPLPPPTIPPTP